MRVWMPSVAALMIVGCVSSGTKVTQQQLTQFQVGKTTEGEVIAALGSPNSVSVLPDGSKTDVYLHISDRRPYRNRESAVGKKRGAFVRVYANFETLLSLTYGESLA